MGTKLDKQEFLYTYKKRGGGLFPSLFNFIYMYVEIISDVEKSGDGGGEGGGGGDDICLIFTRCSFNIIYC